MTRNEDLNPKDSRSDMPNGDFADPDPIRIESSIPDRIIEDSESGEGESWGSTIDPWGGPYDDEPDPDIFPRENAAWHERRRRQASEQEMLAWYATPTGGPAEVLSSYCVALTDARNATGRDSQGEVLPGGERVACSWLGAIGYLLLLDQVGTVLTLAGRRRQPKNVIERSIDLALRDFAPEISSRDRDALQALRRCLARDYSLSNLGLPPGQKFRLKFALDAETSSPLVTHPRRSWDGTPDLNWFAAGLEVHYYFPHAGNPTTRTQINQRALGDLVERCHRAVQSALGEGRLISRLDPLR